MPMFRPNKTEYTVDQWPLNRSLPLIAQTFGTDPCPVCGAPNSTCTGREEQHATEEIHSNEPDDAYELAKAFVIANGGNVAGFDEQRQRESEPDTEQRRPNEFFIEF